MAKLTREEFISSLNEMTTLEIMELVNGMKEEYGIDPTAVAVAAAPAADGASSDEPSSLSVFVKDAGQSKIAVVKIIKEITGLGLKEANDIATKGGAVKENIPANEANDIKAKLEEAGATIELK